MGLAIVVSILIIGLSPVLIPLAIVADAVVDWPRHRFIRVYLMIAALLLNELAGMFGMLFAWVASGFGLFTHRAYSYRILGFIHGQWTHNITRATEIFFDTELNIVGADLIEPAPVIVMQRHISLLDAVVPSKLIAYRKPNAPRHVLMQELRTDPCIGTLGLRTPNHFVDREAGGPQELAAITAVGSTLGPTGSGVIFPEGGFRTEKRFERAVASLQSKDPALAERALRYRHVMPPRPGGTRALLDGAPGVDVVVIAHAGYEGFSTMLDIIKSAPISRPINFELKRIARDTIPTDETAFVHWLFDQYDWIDDFVARHTDSDPSVDLRDSTDAQGGIGAVQTVDLSTPDQAFDVVATGERESLA